MVSDSFRFEKILPLRTIAQDFTLSLDSYKIVPNQSRTTSYKNAVFASFLLLYIAHFFLFMQNLLYRFVHRFRKLRRKLGRRLPHRGNNRV